MIYAYREDINSDISPAGNKLRKLAYVLPHAFSNPKLKSLVTVGGVQSNCCRQAAAVAAKLGLKCIVALTQDVDPQHQSNRLYNAVGNVQLEKLLGADVRVLGPSRDGAQHSAEVDRGEWFSLVHGLSQEDEEGAYFLSQGASGNPGAGVGYAKWAFEMLEKESSLRQDGVLNGSGIFDTIVVACATGGTLAGMVAGMRLAEEKGYINPQSRHRIIGIETFAKDPRSQRDVVLGLARDTAALIGLRREDIRVGEVHVDSRWTAGGYGIYDELTRQTIKMVARTEAMLLDPVYTGKAMAAVVEGIRKGELHGNILFVHTGGSAVLPAYLGIEED
ncbi:uncharacterized protein A1O9_11776 [Exophiala aquamarina CBS 119918]|uniref:Tryptophan synthase beta chain-like PALP domain-containing protein n=1 Tax=Exophiala aquamarina CBS 119918 TaxID=1182545 RepID=A0A072P984_9EURO|nr:uncharacterized protein A1O9_11776 [Exophiala aquamarina CBS 119918]KEF52150.1 hypothetical protein A1O9_11776 [Exophiala aquamarina CBS 119918]